MKYFKWHIFLITGLVCLSPILLGIALWNRLPEVMAIHFDFYGNPDNFASKGFVVFGLPVMMTVVQLFSCIVCDVDAKRKGRREKTEAVAKWMLPFVTVLLQIATLGYGMGWDLDIRKIVSFLLGVIFLVMGSFLPKLDFVKNYRLDAKTAQKINRFIGYESIVMGVLYLIAILLPPVATVVCIVLLIPYTIIGAVYGIVVAKKSQEI